MPLTPVAKQARFSRGFTLVELMIAMVLGLIVVGGAMALFVGQRVTNQQASDMSTLQNEGRIALDAMVREIRGAGDTGCNVKNPNRVINKSGIFAPENYGVFGFPDGSVGSGIGADGQSISLSGSSLIPSGSVQGPVLALTGLYGMIAQLETRTVGNSTGSLTLTGTPDVLAGDVLSISDCLSASLFEVTGIKEVSGNLEVSHAASTSGSILGEGNSADGLGSAYEAGATVGRMDVIWWFVGKNITLGSGSGAKAVSGLFRLSARSQQLQLVSDRVESLSLSYNGNSSKTSINTTGSWEQPKSVKINMTLKSKLESNASRSASKLGSYIELPLETIVGLRN